MKWWRAAKPAGRAWHDWVSERRLGSPGDNPGADKQHPELGRLEVRDPQRKMHQLAARGKICKKKVGCQPGAWEKM